MAFLRVLAVSFSIENIVEEINTTGGKAEYSKSSGCPHEQACYVTHLREPPCLIYGEEEGKVYNQVLGPLMGPYRYQDGLNSEPSPCLFCSLRLCHIVPMIPSFAEDSQRQ